MSNSSLFDMSTTPASNTSVQGINIGEGCSPASINDGMRAMIAQSLGALKCVTAGGTADALTAAPVPAPDSLSDRQLLRVRAASANATTTPTINVTLSSGSSGAKTITKNGNQALAAGDIAGAGHELWLCYNSGNGTVELLNPKGTTVSVSSIADATNGGLAFSASTGTVTANIAPGDLTAKSTPTTSDLVVIGDAASSNAVKSATIANIRKALSGSVQQIVNTETGAVATGTTTWSVADTIPTNTAGDQYMSLAITPTNSSSTLVIDVVWVGTSSVAGQMMLGLFQDTTANALAITVTASDSGAEFRTMFLRHKMTAGTTSATTFKVRVGSNNAGTTTFNGTGGGRTGGGSIASSITITEYLA